MKKSKSIEKIVIFLLCLVCFIVGMAVPIVYNRNSDTNSFEWQKMKKVYSLLTNEWYFGKEVENLEDTLIEQAISGMTYSSLDAHTNYFSLEQAQKFSDILEGSNVGIGFIYYTDEDNNMVVKNVYMDSPADKAGFKPGDMIVEVDGLNCATEDIQNILDRIKEKAEQEINVNIIRDGKEETVKLTPTSYDATVICNIYEDYAEIILSSFSEYSGRDFNLSMERIKKAGINKVIIDLRDNTGGYLNSVLDIASVLLPKDSLVFTEENKNGKLTEQISSNAYSQIKMDKIIILQNGSTASASEVLIGALKSYLKDTVITVGTNTYGKGTEQISVPFTDGTSIKYTCAKWYTPDNENINEVGFKPDIEITQIDAATTKYLKVEEDTIIKKDEVHTNAEALQIYLKFLGYEVDRQDTYFSLASSASLEKYQSEHNLPVTGNCDYDTWNSILDNVLLKMNKNYHLIDNQRQKALDVIK